MSSLCSAHFGKNIFRLSTRKVPKKVPQPTPSSCVYEEIGKVTKEVPPKLPPKKTTPKLNRPLPEVKKTADEVYGFLPGQEFGSTPSLARSCRSLSSSKGSLDKSFIPRNTGSSGHSSGYGSESSCSPPSIQNSPPSIRSSCSSTSGCSSSGSSSNSSSSSLYPKNHQEVAAVLEAANLKCPANVPLFVSRDHTAPADRTGRNEVSVQYGMIINALFKSFDWVYVRLADSREGYIPFACIRPIGKTNNSRYSHQYPERNLNTSFESCSSSSSMTSLTSEESMVLSMQGKQYDPDMSILESMQPRHRSPVYLFPYPELDSLSMSSATFNEDDSDDTASVCSMMSSLSVTSSVFSRYECAILTVLFDYVAMDQDDISVRKHENVTMLNDEDPDWIWVRTVEGREGFIPRTYAADLQALNLDPSAKTTYF